jgi:hypothetical protein
MFVVCNYSMELEEERKGKDNDRATTKHSKT